MIERVAPWYGAWLPELRGGELEMQKRTWWEQWRISALMVFVLFLGVILLFVCSFFPQEWTRWESALHSIAVAIIIAGILGLTIDRVFRKQFAEDAFKASIGYILPNELKGEMEWIYNCPIICVEHIQRCELQPIDDETCRIWVKTQRTLRNVSGSKAKAKIRVQIDEWFHKTGLSRIVSFGYSQGGEKWVAEEGDIAKGEDATIRTTDKGLSLVPDEEIIYWHTTEEIRRVNDEQCWVHFHPTLNPLVSVKAYAGIQIYVGFGHRIPAERLDEDTYRLPGTLLADQLINIRWWEKEDLYKWLQEGGGEGGAPIVATGEGSAVGEGESKDE